MNSFPNKLQRWQIVGAVLIVLLAFVLRVGVIVQRAYNDPSFVPETGQDQMTHINQSVLLLGGGYPDEPFFYQPGPPYVYAIFNLLFDGVNIAAFAFAIAIINALTSGWLIGIGWLLTRRVWGGYLAGLWYAIAAPSVFYGSTLTIAPQAIMWLSLALFLMLWQKEHFAWWRTVWLGITLGIATLLRINFLPILFLMTLWFMLQNHADWKRKVAHVLLLVVSFGGVIGQVTWHNYRTSGDFILLVNIGSKELYWANNRQSFGRNANTTAMENIDTTWEEALYRDIQIAPLRFAGLLGYKFAIFWSPLEVPNNADYPLAQEASSLLRALPFNFAILAYTGLLGLWLLLWKDWRDALFFTLALAYMGGTFLMVFIYGRLRHPAEAFFIPAMAYAVVAIVDMLHAQERKQLALKFAPPIALSVLLISFSAWVITEPPNLPRQRTYNQLPTNANEVNARFGDVVLRGWRPVDAWNAAEQGWVQVFNSYGVELFWQLAEPTEIEHNFYLSYVQDGERITAIDRPLGQVTFPYVTTQFWDTDTIYADILNLRIDEFDAALQETGQIQVGVWYWDDEGLIVNVPMSEPTQAQQLTLQNLSVFNRLRDPDVPDLAPTDITFGDRIALRGMNIPETAQAGETIELEFVWEAIDNITSDYTLLVHLENDAGEIVEFGDAQAISGLLTSNWALNYPLYGTIPLTLPDAIGDYRIFIGFYNTGERLSTASPDGRLHITSLSVR